MNPFIKRVIRKLWYDFGADTGLTFEEWLDVRFPNAVISERASLLDALYDGKGTLWPKRENHGTK
jgi:hypothetical protein